MVFNILDGKTRGKFALLLTVTQRAKQFCLFVGMAFGGSVWGQF